MNGCIVIYVQLTEEPHTALLATIIHLNEVKQGMSLIVHFVIKIHISMKFYLNLKYSFKRKRGENRQGQTWQNIIVKCFS